MRQGMCGLLLHSTLVVLMQQTPAPVKVALILPRVVGRSSLVATEHLY